MSNHPPAIKTKQICPTEHQPHIQHNRSMPQLGSWAQFTLKLKTYRVLAIKHIKSVKKFNSFNNIQHQFRPNFKKTLTFLNNELKTIQYKTIHTIYMTMTL
jgi:ABC-type phosphate/phosphonate transport system permease subunit